MSEEKREVGAKREGTVEENMVCPQIPHQIPQIPTSAAPNKNKQRMVAGLLLVVAASGIATFWPESQKKKMEKNERNLSIELVRIELAGQSFNIPIRYMYGEAIEKHHQWPKAKKERVTVDALSISVLLPDLRPYYIEDDARWKMLGHGDRVEISVMKPVGRKDWFTWLLERTNNDHAKGLATKEPKVHGLIHFNYALYDRYVPVAGPNQLVIRCDRQKPGMAPSCKIKSNYRPGIVLEYYYSLSHLPHWLVIDDNLKSILDRFAVAAQSEQSNVME